MFNRLLNLYLFSLFLGLSHAESTIELLPTDDVWVQKGGFDNGQGESQLQVSPSDWENYWTYLQFSLEGLPDAILDAQLELYSTSGLIPILDGVECLITSDNWSENRLTGQNAPNPTSSVLATGSGNINSTKPGVWTSTAFVLAVRSEYLKDRTVSFILRDSGTDDGARRFFHSKETIYTTKRPCLRIVLADQAFTATPTATSTLTFTPRFTNTPTLTPTGTETPTPTSTYTMTPTCTPTHSWTPTPSSTSSCTRTATPTRTETPIPTATPTFDLYDLSGDGVVKKEDLYFLAADRIYYTSGRDEIFVLRILQKIREHRN